MIEWRYSQLIFTEKNHIYQQCTSYTSAVRKCVENVFSGNLKTQISFFPFQFTLGILHETVNLANCKKTESLGENSCRRESAWIEAWYKRKTR